VKYFLCFFLVILFSNTLVASDITEDTKAMIVNIEKRLRTTCEFKKDSHEAGVLGVFLRAAGIKCSKVAGGTIYPFKSGTGFDSDVYCGQELHLVNFSSNRLPEYRLTIDGKAFVPPLGC